MAYKAGFRPSEILTNGAWHPLREGAPPVTVLVPESAV
jgi:arginine-tRNA-protein transferase